MSKFKNAPKSPLKRDAYKPRLVVHKGGSKVLSQDVGFVVFVLQSLAWTWHGPSLPSEVEDELRRKESLGETDLGTSQTTLLAFSISCQGCGWPCLSPAGTWEVLITLRNRDVYQDLAAQFGAQWPRQ